MADTPARPQEPADARLYRFVSDHGPHTIGDRRWLSPSNDYVLAGVAVEVDPQPEATSPKK